jgi:hypothetical protein
VVPSASERRGDFSALPLAQQPFDPQSGPNLRSQTRFAGGVIPSYRLDTIAQQYLKLFFPLPNSGENTFSGLLPTNFANDQGTARLDLKASDRDNFSFIFLSSHSSVESPVGDLPVTSTLIQDGASRNLIVRHTRVMGSSSINEVTAAAARYEASVQVFAPGGTGVDPAQFGFIGIHPQSNARLGVPALYFLTAASPFVAGYGTSSTKTVWQVKDDFSPRAGIHSLKFGAEARWYNEQRSNAPSDIDGEFEFLSTSPQGTRNEFADFLLGLPAYYVQATDSSAYPRRSAYQFYGLDDVHISQALTINLGLRYELTPPAADGRNQVSAFRPGQQSSVFPNAPAGLIFVGDRDPILGRLPRGLYRTDYRDLAPRIGLAFAPRNAPGPLRHLVAEGKTVIRSGWGVFYDHTALSNSTRISIQTQPYSYFQGLWQPFSLASPFGSGADPWPIDLGKRQFSVYRLYSVDPSFRTPYTYQYDLTVQREITPSTIAEVSYVGSGSFRTVRDRQLNPATVPVQGKPYSASVDSRRIYQSVGSVVSAESSGRARSDSFQAQIRRRFTRGLMFQFSYVLSKASDNGGAVSVGGPPNALRWARSPFDRRQNAVLSFSYDLPEPRLEHGAALVSGWRMSGIIEFRSGLPLDIYQQFDSTLSGTASSTSLPDITGRFRRVDPRNSQTFVTNGVFASGHFFFDPSVFTTIIPSDFSEAHNGNSPTRTFDGPGYNMCSVSVAKTFAIRGSNRIVVRLDARNLFNHVNFETPIVQEQSPIFGQVTSAAPGRTMQFSVRYVF